MFFPKALLYEKEIENYILGQELLKKYATIPKHIIENHNNIEEMRKKQNSEFPNMKQNLIIGVRKTHKYVINHKVSDFLVPYTSSGCTAMCLYCYLVCNYNKCSYLRLFVNREEMLSRLIKTANSYNEKVVFEIGSNSDLILENTITNNLIWTIENFYSSNPNAYITFPTKFDMVDSILNLKHSNKFIIRISVNPREIISSIELGTSNLINRIKAINKLKKAGYTVGILIAPIILIDNWQLLYTRLVETLFELLDEQVKKETFFELIFMTYSYVHTKINEEAFPNAPALLNKELMTGRGRGKYAYKQNTRNEASSFFINLIKKFFPNNIIQYIS